MNTVSAKIMLMNGDLDEKLAYLYACPIEEAVLHRERLINAIEKFEELFGVSRDVYKRQGFPREISPHYFWMATGRITES